MKPLHGKTAVIAHRGASAKRPENTLEAFALAAEMGADGVELDVHYTKDRQVVVAHDSHIDRMSNGRGKIIEYTLEQLLVFDFGYGFYGECRGIRIPTLRQVLELLAPTGLRVNVEIKSADPDIVADCIRIAKETGMEDHVFYSSFDHLQLQRMKEQLPEMTVAPLYSFNMLYAAEYGAMMQAGALHPHFKQIDAFEDYVSLAHEKGICVNVWTVDKEEDLRRMYEKGVDGIITNQPDVALAVRAEME